MKWHSALRIGFVPSAVLYSGFLLGVPLVGPASAQRLVHDHDLNGHAGAVSLDAGAGQATFMLGLKRLEQLDLRTAIRSTLHTFRMCCDVGNHSNVLRDPAGRWLAAASNETLRVIAQPSGLVQQTMVGPGYDLLALAASPSGDRIAGGGQGFHGFAVWDVRSGRLLHRPGESDSMVASALAWSPRGDLIAIGGFDRARRVMVYPPDRPRAVRALKGAPTYVIQLAFNPRGDLLVAGSGGKVVIAWDPVTGKERWRTQERDSAGGYVLSFSPDGRFLLTEGKRGNLMLLDAETGRPVLSWHAHGGRSVLDAQFSPERLFVVSSGHDRRLKIWDLRTALEKLSVAREGFSP